MLVFGLTALFMATASVSRVEAQQMHAAPQAALDAALQEHLETSSADRERLLRLLERGEVKEIAGKAGLDLRRAQSAVATLDAQTLAGLASQAAQVESSLAGGQSTITISTTMIIIGLLLIILIVLIA